MSPSIDTLLNIGLTIVMAGVSVLVFSLRKAIAGGVDAGRMAGRLATVESTIEALQRERQGYCTRREFDTHCLDATREMESLRNGQNHVNTRVDAILASLSGRGA